MGDARPGSVLGQGPGNVPGIFDSSPKEREATFGRLVSRSAVMCDVLERLRRIAERDSTLLLEGESGTGKDLAAHAVHLASARRDRPFMVVDCASPAVEDELFGHERTTSRGVKRGRFSVFARAERGTVFLDEIGVLRAELQPRLLRL